MSITPESPRTLLVVPHTHWDREWYRTFESYRYRLVRALDGVLDNDLPYFLLDGQTVVADDYLAMRPERAETLRAQIMDGRLGFGPWFVLVDEFLVSGEALVRNLLTGRAAMRAMGVPDDSPSVGYLPDMFGHVAQMPQILRGFGLGRTVVWRGATPAAPRFVWRGPDGSELLAAWLPKGYYQTMFMDELTDEARQGQVDAYMAAFAGQNPAWLLSGADHMAPRADLEAQLARLEGVEAHIVPLHAIFHGGRPDAVETGELRKPQGMAYVLPGVLSARTYLKQANADAQRALERYAEPLAAMAWWAGRDVGPMAPALGHAWRTLMLNHPHDSICGCSIDQVHREMMPRFAASTQVAWEVAGDAVAQAPQPAADPSVYVYNPSSWAFDGWVETEVAWPHTEAAPAPAGIALVGPDGAPVPMHLQADEETLVFHAEPHFNPDWFPVRRFRVAVRVALPAGGGVTLRAVPAAAPPARSAPAADPAVAGVDALANDHVALRRVGDRLDLVDLATGRTYADAVRFLDEGDAGDEYNFSPLAGDAPVAARFEGLTLVSAEPHRKVVEGRWTLTAPGGLTPDRQARGGGDLDTRIVVRFALGPDDRAIACEASFDHQAADHRLRLVVGGAAADATAHADSMFGVFARELPEAPALPVAKGTEAVMPEFPQGLFTALAGADGAGVAVAAEGLHEASVLDVDGGRAIALTLLRAVGWLSRDDLRTRGGGAGPRFETPEAQCRGAQAFRFALMPVARGWMDALAPAHGFFAPPKAWQADGPGVDGALVSWESDALVLSALKRSEDGDTLVVRLFNPGEAPVRTRLHVHAPHGGIQPAELSEEPAGPIELGDAVDAAFRPYEIKTWLVRKPRAARPETDPLADLRYEP